MIAGITDIQTYKLKYNAPFIFLTNNIQFHWLES